MHLLTPLNLIFIQTRLKKMAHEQKTSITFVWLWIVMRLSSFLILCFEFFLFHIIRLCCYAARELWIINVSYAKLWKISKWRKIVKVVFMNDTKRGLKLPFHSFLFLIFTSYLTVGGFKNFFCWVFIMIIHLLSW